jgi:hypothetical protein
MHRGGKTGPDQFDDSPAFPVLQSNAKAKWKPLHRSETPLSGRPSFGFDERLTQSWEIPAMKNFVILLLVVAVAAGGLGYYRGWFSVTNDGKVGVQVDAAKFKQDKEAFTKSVSTKTKAMKEQVTHLWTKSEGLTGDEKAHAQKELSELKLQHDRIESRLRELDEVGESNFDTTRQDLNRTLDEVETKITDWTKKLEKAKTK